MLSQGKSSIIETHTNCIPNRQENMCQATDECSLRSPMKPQLSSRFSIITSSINTRNNCTLIFRLCSGCPLYSFSNCDASSIICENFLTYTHETLFVAKSSLSLTPTKQIFSFASFWRKDVDWTDIVFCFKRNVARWRQRIWFILHV